MGEETQSGQLQYIEGGSRSYSIRTRTFCNEADIEIFWGSRWLEAGCGVDFWSINDALLKVAKVAAFIVRVVV